MQAYVALYVSRLSCEFSYINSLTDFGCLYLGLTAAVTVSMGIADHACFFVRQSELYNIYYLTQCLEPPYPRMISVDAELHLYPHTICGCKNNEHVISDSCKHSFTAQDISKTFHGNHHRIQRLILDYSLIRFAFFLPPLLSSLPLSLFLHEQLNSQPVVYCIQLLVLGMLLPPLGLGMHWCNGIIMGQFNRSISSQTNIGAVCRDVEHIHIIYISIHTSVPCCVYTT